MVNGVLKFFRSTVSRHTLTLIIGKVLIYGGIDVYCSNAVPVIVFVCCSVYY